MTYIRTKEIPPGSGNRYRYKQRSYRENGKVKTQTVAYLGPVGGSSGTAPPKKINSTTTKKQKGKIGKVDIEKYDYVLYKDGKAKEKKKEIEDPEIKMKVRTLTPKHDRYILITPGNRNNETIKNLNHDYTKQRYNKTKNQWTIDAEGIQYVIDELSEERKIYVKSGSHNQIRKENDVRNIVNSDFSSGKTPKKAINYVENKPKKVKIKKKSKNSVVYEKNNQKYASIKHNGKIQKEKVYSYSDGDYVFIDDEKTPVEDI